MTEIELAWTHKSRVLLGSFITIIYFIFQFAFVNAIESADAHSIATIRNPCAGCAIEFDRAGVLKKENQDTLTTWARRDYRIDGKIFDHSATVTIRGVLHDPSTIGISEFHIHKGFNRNIPSYVGLVFLVFIWLRSLWRLKKRSTRKGLRKAV